MVEASLKDTSMNTVNETSGVDCGCSCRCSKQTTNSVEIGLLLREHQQSQEEVLALRREVALLQAELAAARVKIAVSPILNDWKDQYLDRGSAVYCSSFAASAWAADNQEGVRLFINQSNTLTELSAATCFLPNFQARVTWNRSFSSPIPLMPHSAIAAANSFLPKSLIPDSSPTTDPGRNVQRVFYFDVDGVLREWVWQSPTFWQTSPLAIKNADPRCLSAICWAEGGFAEWSLFYMTKEEFVDGEWHGGRLYEIRCSGGATGRWSNPTDVGWSRERGDVGDSMGEREPADLSLQSSFSAVSNKEGTDRRIFYLSPASGGPNRFFQSLTWGGRTHNGWIPGTLLGDEALRAPSNTSTGFSALYVSGGNEGIRLRFQDGRSIRGWSSRPTIENGAWKIQEIGSKNTCPNAIVASADLQKNQQYSRIIFSLFDGKIIQTTFINGHGWSIKPIVIERI